MRKEYKTFWYATIVMLFLIGLSGLLVYQGHKQNNLVSIGIGLVTSFVAGTYYGSEVPHKMWEVDYIEY